MSDSLNTGWHLTPEDNANNAGDASAGNTVRIHEMKHAPPVAAGYADHPQEVDARWNTRPVAAVSGIILTLAFGSLFYFGVNNLRGSLTAGGNPVVAITAAGTFDPAQVDVKAGGTLTIRNDNANPQVLKPADTSAELFPVQVIFPAESKQLTISGSALAQTYTYLSETLPANETLTVTVGAVTNPLQPQSAAQTASGAEPIPIPQNITPPDNASAPVPAALHPLAQPLPSSPAQPDAAPLGANPDGQTPVLSFGSSSSVTSSAETVMLNLNKNIPTNTFTVGNASKGPPTVVKVPTEKLHGGAPLYQLKQVKKTTSTGPEVWLIGLVAIAGVALFARREQRI